MGRPQITVIMLPATSSAGNITSQTSITRIKAAQPSAPYVKAITLPITKDIQHTIKPSLDTVIPINQTTSSPIKKTHGILTHLLSRLNYFIPSLIMIPII
jgi:hypothetical protein